MKLSVILLLSVAIATTCAMQVKKRQLQPSNAAPSPVNAASQPVVNNVAAAPVANSDAGALADPAASDAVAVNSQPQVQAAVAPSSVAVAAIANPATETDDDAVAAPTSSVKNAAVPQESSVVMEQPNVGDYFFYDPMEMMYNIQEPNDPAYDPMYDLGEAGDGTNHTCSPIQVALLNNVFYFTRASTLIASIESLLQYEEQLFNSASFQKLLSNAPSDYEYFSLGPKPNQPTTA